MATDKTTQQLDTIRAVWDSNSGWINPPEFIRLAMQYQVTLNDLMIALGVNVQYVADFFYGYGAPNGWGGLPTKKGWFLRHQGIGNPTTDEISEMNAFGQYARDMQLTTVFYLSVVTFPEDPSYHRSAPAQQASVNTWGAGTVATPYAVAVVAPEPVYVPTPAQRVTVVPTVAPAPVVTVAPVTVAPVTVAPVTVVTQPSRYVTPGDVRTTLPANAAPYYPPANTTSASGSGAIVIAAIVAALGFLS